MEGEYRSHQRKRNKRRAMRGAVFGPERAIVSTSEGQHLLSCGHRVPVHPAEHQRIRRRRCARCLTRSLNEMMAPHCQDGLPFACEGCGATRSIGPVEGVPGVKGECRECHALVSETPEDPVRAALVAQEWERSTPPRKDR